MKKLLYWLASLFKVEEVWIDKGYGQWVMRRRYHPVTKAAVLVCLLVVAGFGVRELLRQRQAPDEISQDEAPEKPELKIAQIKMTDFPELSADVLPGPIPSDLEVAGDEYWVRVDKGDYRLYLYRGFDVEKTYEVAVGRNPGDKERAGDNKTPNGIFTVQSIENASSWVHDFGDGKGTIKGAYGPWFIRLRTKWRGIGIHGTHDPDSLGSMVSEGCIRMHNAELEELKTFASAKMKVVIEE